MQSGFDYTDYPVIKPTSDCDWEITTMEWGFLPDTWFGKPIDSGMCFPYKQIFFKILLVF